MGESRTKIEFRPALADRERMIRGRDGIIRDECLQTANLLKIAFGQGATPIIITQTVCSVGSKVSHTISMDRIRTIRRRYR